MHQRQRALEIRLVQIGIIFGELIGEEHALVDNGAARHRRRIIAGEAAISAALRSKKACGICTRMPAPSPARGSAPTAPRCSRLQRMLIASETIRCDFLPLML